jgi:hypothetical protein
MHGGDIGGFRSGSMYPGNAMGSGWHGDSDMGHHGGGMGGGWGHHYRHLGGHGGRHHRY